MLDIPQSDSGFIGLTAWDSVAESRVGVLVWGFSGECRRGNTVDDINPALPIIRNIP